MNYDEFLKCIDGEVFKTSFAAKKNPALRDNHNRLTALRTAMCEGRVLFPLIKADANDLFLRVSVFGDKAIQRGKLKHYEYFIVSSPKDRDEILRDFPRMTYDHWFEQ